MQLGRQRGHPEEGTVFQKDARWTLSRSKIEHTAKAALEQMTLKEKGGMLHGDWDVLDNLIRHRNMHNPVPIVTTGVSCLKGALSRSATAHAGVVMGRSTCFPVSMARGASFNRELEQRVGDVIGKECRAQGADFFGGVCVNLLRHPA